ncbi:arginase family protein [Fodinicola feengrottensis]|uniref:arginase family protein n=1 Tax=Fodinicola feengrottensis TaxID=435914 RepID=UPI002441DCDB|nr:arginase family protein [Fodinicola feengrottensis]
MTDHSTGDAWDLIVSPWHLDEHIPAFPIPANTTQVVRPTLSPGPVPVRMSLLHQATVDAVTRTARPLVLSGDCPTARAVVAGLQRRQPDLAVLWLDAHGDFNTPAISTSGYLGGMAIAMLTGRTPELFDDALGLRPVAETSVVLADARDLDPAERDALAASQVRRVPADPAAITAALGELGRTPVHVHLDVDVIDSSQLPDLRFPSGPGPPSARSRNASPPPAAPLMWWAPVSPAPGCPTASATRPPAMRSLGSSEHSAPTWYGPTRPFSRCSGNSQSDRTEASPYAPAFRSAGRRSFFSRCPTKTPT